MPKQATVTGSTTRTVTGVSNAMQARPSGRGVLVVAASVTAVSGTTPSMTLSLEWSDDGTTWFVSDPVDTMTAFTAAANRVKVFTVKASQYRIRWTLTGTNPSFTFVLRDVQY